MLKIKEERMKDLESLGFEHKEYDGYFSMYECYHTEHYVYNKNDKNMDIYIPLKKIYFGNKIRFYPRQIIMDGIEFDLFNVPDIIFNLIKADMVEKVDE